MNIGAIVKKIKKKKIYSRLQIFCFVLIHIIRFIVLLESRRERENATIYMNTFCSSTKNVVRERELLFKFYISV